MPTPRLAPYRFLCAVLFLSAAHSSASAQFHDTEVQLRTPEDEVLQVTHILERSFEVVRHTEGSAVVRTTSSRDVCETPCRFVLDKPMELVIQNSSFVVTPEGGIQRYQITPARPGLRVLSVFATSVSSAAVVLGASVLYYRGDSGISMPGIVSGARWAVALGVPVLIASIIGLVRSRSRVRRVDAFEF